MKNIYYQENKEKILERQKLYIKNNKEKVLKQKREWARKHRAELREKGLMPPTKKQLQQRIDKAIEYINKTQMPEGYKKMLLIMLGDKENE